MPGFRWNFLVNFNTLYIKLRNMKYTNLALFDRISDNICN